MHVVGARVELAVRPRAGRAYFRVLRRLLLDGEPHRAAVEFKSKDEDGRTEAFFWLPKKRPRTHGDMGRRLGLSPRCRRPDWRESQSSAPEDCRLRLARTDLLWRRSERRVSSRGRLI